MNRKTSIKGRIIGLCIGLVLGVALGMYAFLPENEYLWFAMSGVFVGFLGFIFGYLLDLGGKGDKKEQ